jgi:hypothetical protein
MATILQKIKRGGESLPPRVSLAGPEGIGKSTFGASAPAPLFISQEDGLTGLDHVARLTPESFADVLAIVDELTANGSEYKTLVIDTMDWLERSIHSYVCTRDGKASIEDYGYGKGYKVAEQELVLLLSKLDALRQRQKMGIILLSHVHIKPFNSPDGTAWDRYENKGHKGFTGILREWPDACLFAVYEVFKSKEKGSDREKVIGGDRIIHTQWSPGWDAKNRLGLPETLPLSWEEFDNAVQANRPDKLREQYLALLQSADMPSADREKWAKVDVSSLPPDRVKGGIAKLQSLQPKTK